MAEIETDDSALYCGVPALTGLEARPDRSRQPGYRKPSASSHDAGASDEGLLQQIGNGDELAMQTLYARHHALVYRFVLRLIGNTATAEELTSDVFLGVWHQARRFERRSTVRTWLLAIARLKALTALRCRQDEPLDEQVAGAIEDPSDSPEAALHNKERHAIVRRCVSRLSCEHREVTNLVFFHEKSIEEVARIVNVPPRTVKMRMFHARRELADLLRAEGIVSLAA